MERLTLLLITLVVACSSTTTRQDGPLALQGGAGGELIAYMGGAATGGAPATTGGTEPTGGLAAGSGAPTTTGGTTGGTQATGGAATGGTTGGVAIGGAPPTGGAPEPTGGTGGEPPSEPDCAWQTAVTGLPSTFTWQDWSAQNLQNECARCVHEPCGSGDVQLGSLSEGYMTVRFWLEAELEGGLCHAGPLSKTCWISGSGGGDWITAIYQGGSIRWNGDAWQLTIDRSQSVVAGKCIVNAYDLDEWSHTSMNFDLVEESADWIESLSWSCP